MATKTMASKVGVEEGAASIHHIRITLTSKNVKNLEKGEWVLLWGCGVGCGCVGRERVCASPCKQVCNTRTCTAAVPPCVVRSCLNECACVCVG